jgi:hypothetical protein
VKKLLLLLGIVMLGCSSKSPTSPSLDYRFNFKNTTPEQQVIALSAWEQQQSCVGAAVGRAVKEPNEAEFYTFPGPEAIDDCGAPAIGCTAVQPGLGLVWMKIVANYHGTDVFQGVAKHEMIHAALAQAGVDSDPCHRTSIWQACGSAMKETC